MFLLLLPAIATYFSHSVASDVLKIQFNTTAYIDKGENILRVPNITLIDDKEKRKPLKKAPRRTIQKIIRKHKAKKKNLQMVTQSPSQTKEQFDTYDIYAKEEMLQKLNTSNRTTTQANQKKQKKWNKLSRYPMPFQKMSFNREVSKNINVFRRNKRSEDQQQILILKDLDELQFLSKDQDYDVVNAHLQNHW